MDIDEYESLPTTSVGVNMTAGASAGIMEHCVMYPVDSVKTRMQQLTPEPGGRHNARTVLFKMIHQEGLRRSFRGVSVMVAGAGPAHALYFSCYEMIKNRAMAGASAAAATTPLDVCKTVLNTQQNGVKPQGMVQAIQIVYNYAGIPGFFRGLSARICYQIPATAICWSTYEFFKYFLTGKHDDPCSTTEPETFNTAVQHQLQVSRTNNPTSFPGTVLFNNKSSGPVLLDVTQS
ncbi:hypothetical protein G9C98_006974 [Cotesia typhae]|uniref:Uncharacterized protein n=1 Tax=Cotesia typhae TaxID=2053667 RepID=A0A8J5R168_9HYME|nr:hypothetical protein G9C98_006974 [Cotesia typhae]